VPVTGFALRVDDELELVLREAWTVAPLHELIVANLEHLRPWEPWARGEQTVDDLSAFTRRALGEWIEGRSLPTALRFRGRLVGGVGAQLNSWFGTAEVGYWIDAGHQGRGFVTRAVGVLVQHLFQDRGIARVEIRTAVGNQRSRAVAERLGFEPEGVLRSAQPALQGRHDVCVYGRTTPPGV
jgi:ribosomal-protein-serine acetyltransferase